MPIFYTLINKFNVIPSKTCDIVIYIKKNIFGLGPHFWYRAPKALGIS